MNGQLSLFDIIPDQKTVKPGEWVTEDILGEELSFGEITHIVGQTIIVSYHTENLKSYKAVHVERIVSDENGRRLFFYDGMKQRGCIAERWFDKGNKLPVCAWKIKE